MSCGPVKTKRSAAGARRSAMLKKRDTARAKHAAAVHARECAIHKRGATAVTPKAAPVSQKPQKAAKPVKAQKA